MVDSQVGGANARHQDKGPVCLFQMHTVYFNTNPAPRHCLLSLTSVPARRKRVEAVFRTTLFGGTIGLLRPTRQHIHQATSQIQNEPKCVCSQPVHDHARTTKYHAACPQAHAGSKTNSTNTTNKQNKNKNNNNNNKSWSHIYEIKSIAPTHTPRTTTAWNRMMHPNALASVSDR